MREKWRCCLDGRRKQKGSCIYLQSPHITMHNSLKIIHLLNTHTIHSTKRQPQRKSDKNFKSEDRERLIHCVHMYELADSDATNNFISISQAMAETSYT